MTKPTVLSGLRTLPDLRRLSWLETAALALLVALALRVFSLDVAGLDWDESLYIVMAQRWLQGDLPYVGVWDQHPVGLPALLAAATWLAGDGLLAARVAALLAVAATSTMLYVFLVRRANAPLAGLLAALFYLFYMSRPDGLAANTEVFNNLVISAASLLLASEMTRADRPRAGIMFASGLLLGVGLQFKYVVLPEAVLFCCALLWKMLHDGGTLRRTLWFALVAMAGGLLPTALATLYFWLMGELPAYLDANLRANVAYLDEPLTLATAMARLRFGLLPLIGLLPWPAVLLVLLRDPRARERYGALGAWLALWLVAASLDVAAPMKLWKHYFNALVPPLCIIAGLTVVLLANRAWPRRRIVTAGLVAAVLLPAIGSMAKNFPYLYTIDRPNIPRAIADFIGLQGGDGRDIYVFNYDPLLYAYAHAVPPTRYVLGIELSDFSASAGSRPAGEITRILAAKPRWIIIADPSPYQFAPQVWRELTLALQSYRLAAAYPESDYIQPPITVRVYERSEPLAGAG